VGRRLLFASIVLGGCALFEGPGDYPPPAPSHDAGEAGAPPPVEAGGGQDGTVEAATDFDAGPFVCPASALMCVDLGTKWTYGPCPSTGGGALTFENGAMVARTPAKGTAYCQGNVSTAGHLKYTVRFLLDTVDSSGSVEIANLVLDDGRYITFHIDGGKYSLFVGRPAMGNDQPLDVPPEAKRWSLLQLDVAPTSVTATLDSAQTTMNVSPIGSIREIDVGVTDAPTGPWTIRYQDIVVTGP
jgi:hypothetical protein